MAEKPTSKKNTKPKNKKGTVYPNTIVVEKPVYKDRPKPVKLTPVYISSKKVELKGGKNVYGYTTCEEIQLILTPTQRKPSSVMIPVDKNGYVPQDALYKRFWDVGSGAQIIPKTRKIKKVDEFGNVRYVDKENVSPSREKRIPYMDWRKRANIVLSGKLTPRQVAGWWAKPWSLDIEGIDTPEPYYKMDKIKYTGRPEATGYMNAQLKTSLNAKEQERLKDLSTIGSFDGVTIRPFSRDEEGAVAHQRTQRIGGKATYDLAFNQRYLANKGKFDNEIVAHEMTHAMREYDELHREKIKKGLGTRQGLYEEALTTAESLARAPPNQIGAGYYPYIPLKYYKGYEKSGLKKKPSKNALESEKILYDIKRLKFIKKTLPEMIKDDRNTMTYGMNKNLKGEDALRSVKENFPKTYISKIVYYNREGKEYTFADRFTSKRASLGSIDDMIAKLEKDYLKAIEKEKKAEQEKKEKKVAKPKTTKTATKKPTKSPAKKTVKKPVKKPTTTPKKATGKKPVAKKSGKKKE